MTDSPQTADRAPRAAGGRWPPTPRASGSSWARSPTWTRCRRPATSWTTPASSPRSASCRPTATPRSVADYCKNARMRGLRVIIAGAGLTAALPGVAAAHTDLPVIGVPLTSALTAAGGLDAILSVVQMPPGRPGRRRRPGQREERGAPARCASSNLRVIARYTRPEIGAVWTDEARMETWRRVEVAAAEELAEGPTRRGPRGDPRRDVHRRGGPRAREDHRPRRRRVRRRAQRERRGGRPLDPLRPDELRRARHRARAAAQGRRRDRRPRRARGHRRAGRAGARAPRHGLRRAHPRRARRADDVRHQARGLRLRGRPQRRAARAGVRPGERRRAQRRGRHLRDARPGLRGARARRGSACAARTSPRRSSRATATPSCCRRSRWPAPGSSASPPRSATCSAPRSARSRSRSAAGKQKGSSRDAPQAQPDHHRAHHRAGARAARLRPGGRRERRAVARARHLATPAPSASSCPTRRSSWTTCSRSPCAWSAGWSSTPTGCARTSTSPTARCSPSACCSRSSRAACSATTPTGSSRSPRSRPGTAHAAARAARRPAARARPRTRLRLRRLHAPRGRDRRPARRDRLRIEVRSAGGEAADACRLSLVGVVDHGGPGPWRSPRRRGCRSRTRLDSERDLAESAAGLARCGGR